MGEGSPAQEAWRGSTGALSLSLSHYGINNYRYCTSCLLVGRETPPCHQESGEGRTAGRGGTVASPRLVQVTSGDVLETSGTMQIMSWALSFLTAAPKETPVYGRKLEGLKISACSLKNK